MPTLMQRGATWLGTRLQTAGGREVTYRRGNGTPVTLTATPTRIEYTVAQSDGSLTQVESWDWIITAEDLGFDPIPGDEIRETINGVAKVYHTMPLQNNKCFDWSDTAGILLTVHSKLVESRNA
jgi:hypothetical protein